MVGVPLRNTQELWPILSGLPLDWNKAGVAPGEARNWPGPSPAEGCFPATPEGSWHFLPSHKVLKRIKNDGQLKMPNSLANGLRTQLFSIATSSTGEGPGQVFFLPFPGIQKHQLWPELLGGQVNLLGSSAEALLLSPRSPHRGQDFHAQTCKFQRLCSGAFCQRERFYWTDTAHRSINPRRPTGRKKAFSLFKPNSHCS